MGIYIVVLMLSLIMALVSYQMAVTNKGNNIANTNSAHRYKKMFILLAAIILLVIGLRADVIGRDTWNYKNTYETLRKRDFSYLKNYKWYEEIGYAFIIILFNKVGLPWQIYAVFMAALFVVPIMVLIFKDASNSFFSLTIFIMSGLWTYPMSTMRQAAAIGLCVIAFLFEDKKLNLFSIATIFLAALFHVSALIALLYFIVCKIKITKSNAVIWLITALVIVVGGLGPLRNIFQQLMSFFGRDYHSDHAVGGWLQEIFFILTLIIAWFYGDDKDEKYWKYFKAIYLSAVLLPIVRINPALFRVYTYFSVYQVVFIPRVLYKIKESPIKITGYIGYFAVYLYLFITTDMLGSLQVVPYRFFWM